MWTVSCFPPSSVLRVLLLLTFVPRAEPSLRPSVKPVLYGQNQMFYRFFRMLQYRLRTKLLIFSCNQHCCSVCQCLLPILSALNRGTLTLKTTSWFHSNLLLSHQKVVWEKKTVSWPSRSSSVVWTAVPSRRRVGGLFDSLWRGHQARKYVDGAPKTIAHHHLLYSGIHGSIKTTPSTGETLHTSNKDLFSGPVPDKNCQVLFGHH